MTTKQQPKASSNISVFNLQAGVPSSRCYVERAKSGPGKPRRSDAGAWLDEDDRIRALAATKQGIQMENASGFAFQLLDALPIQIFVKDPAGHFVYVNAMALEYLGYPRQNPIGKLDQRVIHDRSIRKHVRKEDLATMKGRVPRPDRELWTNNLQNRRTNKTWRFPIFSPTNPQGEPIGVVAVGEDITAAEFERAAREIGALVTHDWMNGFLSMLAERFRILATRYADERDELTAYSMTMDFLHGYWDLLRWYLNPAPGSEIGTFPFGPLQIDFRKEVFDHVRAVVETVYPSGPSLKLEGPETILMKGDLNSLRIFVFLWRV